MSSQERLCQECQEILRGRSDQKFCSDQCRNTFNNRNNADATNLIRNVNNALRKNRRILEASWPGKNVKISKEKLIQKGVNFQYLTHIYETKKGDVYHFCYDMGYLQLENDEVLLVKRDN